MNSEQQQLATAIIQDCVACSNLTPEKLGAIKRKSLRQSPQKMIDNHSLLQWYRHLVKTGVVQKAEHVESALQIHPIRSQSGIAVITLLTMPAGCPGRCSYCPTESRMPKSYVATEPAAARALTLQFDPYIQTENRITTLRHNAHSTDKIELIIKGGTWSAYPKDYREWFIQQCFQAMNETGVMHRDIVNANPSSQFNRFWGDEKDTWSMQKLTAEQHINETALNRCIGLTIETRPDWVTVEEIVHLRQLGCTRVELGLQTTDDEILKNIKRGHTAEQTAQATKLLKDAGFKVDHHLMPGLPGATPEKDLAVAKEVFASDHYQPDTIKLYPCVILPSTEIYTWYKEGRFIPYSTEILIRLLAEIKALVPPYMRVARVIRDFPSPEIAGGNLVTNLRETIQKTMKEQGLQCTCLRCREVGHVLSRSDLATHEWKPVLKIRSYAASGGMEYFLSYESDDEKIVYAFLRMRFPSPDAHILYEALPEIAHAALIRELHTYGSLVPIDTANLNASQHRGLGKALLAEAEKIAREHSFKKIAVISGVGVRDYYKKQGYTLEGTYMVKILK
ncbi:MAG: tRNA uridine(34) 5-carboxymethylaminomethyl modification radical SAM/GNAT enzyme Elp3 [Patescibacteria group bacterium]